jgi:hypothetical protein
MGLPLEQPVDFKALRTLLGQRSSRREASGDLIG